VIAEAPNRLGIIPERLKATDIETLPYPGFPTDMQAQFMALLAESRRQSDYRNSVRESVASCGRVESHRGAHSRSKCDRPELSRTGSGDGLTRFRQPWCWRRWQQGKDDDGLHHLDGATINWRRNYFPWELDYNAYQVSGRCR